MGKKKTQTQQTVSAENPGTDVIALDMGNAYTNLESDNGIELDWRSIMAPLSDANRIAEYPIADVIQFGGQWWTAGDACYTLAPDGIQEYPTVNRYISDWYRRLFAFALHKTFYKRVGTEVVYPKVITSIPASSFKNRAETEAVKNSLAGDYEIGNVYGGTLHVHVNPRFIVIIPEGIGSYFQFVFGPGNNNQYQGGTWMIADSGYLTLDAVMVRDGEYIGDAARSDEKTGLSVVAERLRDFVFTRARVRLDRPAVDKAMECDSIIVNQKQVNIVQAREDALAELGRRATVFLEQWSASVNLNGILFTGGGAKYLYHHIISESLAPLTLVPNGRRANVHGAYLYAVNA